MHAEAMAKISPEEALKDVMEEDKSALVVQAASAAAAETYAPAATEASAIV